LTLSDCISAAGGITENARRNKAYVVYFNGRAKRTRTFGIFRFNPTIEPGSEVVLPEGEKRKDALTGIFTICYHISSNWNIYSYFKIID
jgi:protein involved in polysaccharide export with SLBB domain